MSHDGVRKKFDTERYIARVQAIERDRDDEAFTLRA